MKSLLPAHLLKPLDPYFQQANATLQRSLGKAGLRAWNRHVAVVQPTQPLLPADVNGEAVATVHEALAERRQLELRYRRRGEDKAVRYRLHPLGLVYRGVVGYLVGTVADYDDPRLFALHRITSATMLDRAAHGPPRFDLQAYARSGAFGFMDNGPIRLDVRMQAAAAAHLRETPLSLDQRIFPDTAGWVHITATVRYTSELVWWLRGFGHQAQVLKPTNLLREVET